MPNPSDRYKQFHDAVTLEHDPDLAAALGNMIAAWSYAETAILSTAHHATGSDYRILIDIFSSVPTFDSKVKIASTLVRRHVKHEAERTALLTAIQKLSRLAGVRNGWVHGSWAVSDDRKVTVIFDMRSEVGTTDRRRLVRPSDVVGHYETVLRRSEELMLLARQLPSKQA